MIAFTNDDLYQIILDRLRKDRKGALAPEEFESFLRQRNMDYFNQQIALDGVSMLNQESLRPFLEHHSVGTLLQQGSSGRWYVDMTLGVAANFAHMVSAFTSVSLTVWTTIIEIDIVSNVELMDRINNAITAPSVTNPVGFIDDDKFWVYGPSSGIFVVMSYYVYPEDPYFDYYTDASGNVTYLTDGQAEYTLQAGEVARDGSVAGAGVTSASNDLLWDDKDAMNILDMVMTDAGVSQSDQAVVQTSIVERQNNARS